MPGRSTLGSGLGHTIWAWGLEICAPAEVIGGLWDSTGADDRRLILNSAWQPESSSTMTLSTRARLGVEAPVSEAEPS